MTKHKNIRHTAVGFVLSVFLFSLIMVFSITNAHAQCADEDRAAIHAINKNAMEQYQNMDFGEARSLLQSAFKKAEETECTLDWIHAKTLINLGILLAGGEENFPLARKFFIEALRVRPEAPLDREVATPALTKIYNWARKRLRIREEPAPWPEIEVPVFEDEIPDVSTPSIPLEHSPVDQAPQGMPIEITCRISDEVRPQEVHLFYRPFKESGFQTVRMEKTDTPYTWRGFIPGEAVWGASIQYYIRATPESENVLASSGSMISPHIIEVVAEGGLSDRENPLLKKTEALRKERKKRFQLRFGPAFGVGLARGTMEVMDEQGTVAVRTGLPYDRIDNPGLAPGSLGGTLEFGYRITPKLLLGLQGRLGYIKMFTKNVPGAAFADFAALLRVRYDIMDFASNWLGLYAGGGLGYAQIRHAVPLNHENEDFTDTTLSMGVTPTVFTGLRIGREKIVSGYLEIAFLTTIWNDADLFTFHMDFTLGVCFSF